MTSNKEAVVEAVKAGKSEAQVKTLAGQHASLASQMLTLQAQTFAKMWAILRSDQKAHVDAAMYDDIGAMLANTTPPPSSRDQSRRRILKVPPIDLRAALGGGEG